MRERTYVYHATQETIREMSDAERAQAREVEMRERASAAERAAKPTRASRNNAATKPAAVAGDPAAAAAREAEELDQIRVRYVTTPLHEACAAGNGAEVERLLRLPESACWLEQQDSLGWVPLHFAAMVDDQCVVELLLPKANVEQAINEAAQDDEDANADGSGARAPSSMSRSESERKTELVTRALTAACEAEGWGDAAMLAVSYQGAAISDVKHPGSFETFALTVRPLVSAAVMGPRSGSSVLAGSLKDPAKLTPDDDLTGLGAIRPRATAEQLAAMRASAPDVRAPFAVLPDELLGVLASARRGHAAAHVLLAERAAAFVSGQGRRPGGEGEGGGAVVAEVFDSRPSPGVRRIGSVAATEGRAPVAAAVAFVADAEPSAMHPLLHGARARIKAQADSLRCVHALLDAKADVNCRDLVKVTPLHKSAANGRLAVACALVLRGAHLDARDAYGDTALHRVAWNGQLPLAKLLLSYGCPVDTANHREETSLHFAALCGDLSMLKELIRHGASLLKRTSQGLSVLHVAVRGGSKATIEALRALYQERGLLWKDAITTVNRDTPVHIAIRAGHVSLIDWMIQRGFGRSMARCNKFGDTPAGTALRLVKKFKAKGKVGKKGAKGAKKSAPAAADAAARPGTAAPAKKKKKASKKGKAAEGPTEPVIDTDITYQLLDAKRVELLVEAAEWMGKKEKTFAAEIAALEKNNAVPTKKGK